MTMRSERTPSDSSVAKASARRPGSKTSSRGASKVTAWSGFAPAVAGGRAAARQARSSRAGSARRGISVVQPPDGGRGCGRSVRDVLDFGRMPTHAIAADDVVATHEAAAGNDRAPLLVLEPLLAFLDREGLGDGYDLDVEPVSEGHSNVTYVIRRGDWDGVIRRPPRPPIPPSAHDVLREARVLRALERTPVRVPRVLATCDDESVIGAPFYVMERLEGEVITRTLP